MSSKAPPIFILQLSLLFLLIGTSPLLSQPSNYVTDNEVIVFYDHQLKAAADDILKLYPPLKLEVKEKLGWGISYRPRVVLFRDSSDFQNTVNNPYILAYAVPSQGLIVIDYSKMSVDPFRIETTLKHELAHLILHEHITYPNLPRWLDEGIAQWVCGGIGEVIFLDRRSVLEAAVLSGRFIPFSSLERKFPADRNSLLLSYEQSKSFVEFIIKKYGEDGLRNLLDRLKNGHSIDEAVSHEFSLSLADLEAEWKHRLRRQAVWLTYLISHLYEFLFILGGLLLCYGFVRIWLKKRSMTDEYWSDSEE